MRSIARTNWFVLGAVGTCTYLFFNNAAGLKLPRKKLVTSGTFRIMVVEHFLKVSNVKLLQVYYSATIISLNILQMYSFLSWPKNHISFFSVDLKAKRAYSSSIQHRRNNEYTKLSGGIYGLYGDPLEKSGNKWYGSLSKHFVSNRQSVVYLSTWAIESDKISFINTKLIHFSLDASLKFMNH